MKYSAYLLIRRAILFSIFLFIVFSFPGCTKESEPSEIQVGVILPLTGSAGKYGEDAKLGIELAAEEKNSQGGIDGKSVKIVLEDDQSEPKQTIAALRKLIAVHKISVVIGGMTSSSALAAAPIAEQNRVVFLSPSASVPALTKAGDFIFRNELSDSYGGVSQAELTWNKLGIKKVAILYINNDYGVGVKDAFQQTFVNLGGQVVEAQPFEPDAQDFRSQLTLIKAKSLEYKQLF
jgi:branched-chain amino acid transport system substrate-binding protein